MNKSEIVGRVAWRMGLSKARAEHALDTVLAAIGEALAKDEEVRIAGFGRFATRSRAARTGRNPRSGERVAIPASRMPSFKAGKVLRELVNGGGDANAGDAAGAARTGWEALAASALARERGIEAEGPAETELRTDLSKWPGGVAPVWILLEPESVEALRAEPSAENRTLRLAANLPDEAVRGSAFVRNALSVLERIDGGGWLWLTGKGNFGRDTVAGFRESMTWPGMEATEQFRQGKALREGDVWELHLLHRLLEVAGLIEGRAGLCQLTALGHGMLMAGRRGALQALLFRHAFWHLDLSRYVGGLPRKVPDGWPQASHMGQVLWCLSAVGDEWHSVDTLTALCAARDESMPSAHWRWAGWMFAGRILGLLRWFHLFEWRLPEEMFDARCWRKTALFDRFLTFDVRLADGPADGH